MLNLKEADVTQTRFYQEVLELGRQQGQMVRNHREYKIWRKIGWQIGWKEGRINAVLRQINRRCGQLSIAQQVQIKSLPMNAIESLAEALLDFKGMEDLEIWLRENVV